MTEHLANSASTAGSPPESESLRNAPWLFPLIVTLVIAAAYVRAPSLDLVFDDDIIVKANPYITSAHYIPSYFTQHIWSNLMQARKNYYRPVFLLWLLGNYKDFGTDPIGWHLSSLVLHLGNAVLLYFLALRFTRERFSALAASLLFGLHPVQVENVAWVSCSTELLGSFLTLAAALCYFRSLEFPARGALLLAASVSLYGLAVLAKETAIIFPVIVFLHEWLGRPVTNEAPLVRSAGARFSGSLLASLPFGIATLAYLAARIAVLGALGTPVVSMTKKVWFETIPSILQIYLQHLVWPARLSAFYDYPYIAQFSVRAVILPAALLAGLGILLFIAVRKSPAAQLAAMWMVLPILPVLDIPIFPRGEILHDRYLYHPLIGLSLLAGLGIAALERRWASRGARWAIYSACGSVALAMGAATFHQTGYWTDNFSLYTHGVEVAPRSGFANMNLGSVLFNRGHWNESMALMQKAIEYAPNLYLAHYDMGLAYYQVERFSEAEACFKRAIAILPEYPDSHLSLGMTYYRTHRLPEAIGELRKAIALDPSDAGPHFALGVMLKDSGDLAGARAEMLEVLKRDPQQGAALKQLHEIEQRAGPAESSTSPAGPKAP